MFSSAGGNAIQISDVDAASSAVQVTLSVTNGTLTLGSTTGLTLSSGANGSATMTYTGTVSAFNTAFNAGLTFTPTTGFIGLAQLTLVTNDQGNTGTGGPLSDTDTLNIHVGAIVVTNATDVSNGTVTSITNLIASDGGDGISLREAIQATNATVGADRIAFAISSGAQAISLSSALPTITETLTIDGWTQPGYAGTPLVIVDGEQTAAVGLQLTSTADSSTIRGLVLRDFSSHAIQIDAGSSNNTVEGNYIGSFDVAGTDQGVGEQNVGNGIYIQGDHNTIGGTSSASRNVISGNQSSGILISGTNASYNTIQNNYIGLDATGTTAVANSISGVRLASGAHHNAIGTPGFGNVISGNAQTNVFLDDGDDNTIQANYIGTNAAGTGDVNGTGVNTAQSGIVMQNGSTGNLIGGTTDAERNIISGNNWYGVEILTATTRNNTVSGNYIGTDVTGLIALGNSGGGASFWGAGTGNVLGGGAAGAGNVISGNAGHGVYAGNNANTATIQGNIIGLGADGSTTVGNTNAGIYLDSGAKYTLIGSNADGTNDPAERNVISGNANGIVISGTGTYGNEVYGNYVGTDATGLLTRGNTNDGERVESGAANNYLGGAAAAHRNIIAGNGGDGIQIDGEDSDGNSIQKNWIGLAADGVTALGNGGIGIFINGGADNTIVGGALLGNVIVGPTLYGIIVEGSSSGTVIEGNYIGTDESQTVHAGIRYHGILIRSGANNNTIGGTSAWQGNVVANYDLANQGYDGVRIYPDGGAGNTVMGNSIYQAIAYSGSGLGIDIASNAVTPNDTLDADTGANDGQNFPVLSTATVNAPGTTVTVSGSINTLASVTGVVLHFYATPSTGNYNSRQGQRYLGSTTVNTDASGNATFTNVALTGYSGSVAAGDLITATATYANSTSEFSQGIVATASAGNSAPSALQATETQGGGLRLNADGGNDAYLISNTGLPSALSAMTVEVRFAANDTPTETVFISYNTAGGDEMSLNISGPTNGLELDFGTGSVIVSNAINYRTALLDGAEHTLSVTWSNTAGAWAVYIDGVLTDSGSGLFTGGTLSTGGRFVFGQEQDALGGGFDANQYFSGTLYEARIFNTVRTATQIAAAERLTLPYDTSGLILNWRFDELSTAGVVTERVRGNDLTLGHAVGTGFSASTPALTLTVRENAATGTVIGTLAGLDIDREAKITQLLAADANLRYSAETGKFYKLVNSTSTWSAAQSTATATTLGGVAGQLVTIGSASENALIASFAQSMSNSVWIGASDQAAEGVWRWYAGTTPSAQFWQGGGTGYNVGDAYTLWQSGEPSNGGGTEHFAYLETDGTWNDVSATASFAKLIIEWNADAVLDATHALSYTITSQTLAGAFTIDGSTGVITVADSSLLDYEINPSHALTVRVTDSGGLSYDKTFNVTVSNVTVEPTLSAPSNATTSEDTALVFSTSNGNPITVSDHDASTNSPLQVSMSVANGNLTLAQTTGLTFISGANGSSAMVINGTESDINSALDGLIFTPNGNFSGSDTLQINVTLHADMAGWYTFAGRSANDQSAGTAYDGTFAGSATTVIDAQRGEVLRLDGDHDCVQIDGTFGDPTNVTLAAWVRFDSADTGGGEVISLGDHLGLRVDSPSFGVTAFFWDGASWQQINTGISLADGQWHHLAFSFDDTANTQTLYIDGVAVASAAFTASIAHPGWFTYTRIGDHVSDAEHDFSFNGLIDDVRIYTRALSAAEIATLASDTAMQAASVTINVTAINDAPTFSVGDGRNYLPVADIEFGNAVARQADGKYLVTGWSDVNGTRDFILARFNADGSLDTTFGASTGYVVTDFLSGSDEARDVLVLSNGKILVVGHSYVGGNFDLALAQYNADGSPDVSFGGGTGKALSGIADDDTGYALAIQSDGKILVGGGTSLDFLLARFNANGTLDTSFGTGGRVTTDFAINADFARSLIVQPDGKIILAGRAYSASTWTDFAVARYHSNGTLDTSFNGTGKVMIDLGANVQDDGYAVALQNDGQLLITGWSQAGGTADLALIRLTAAGTLDSSFGTAGKVITPVGSGSDFGLDVKVQADGKVLVSGYAYASGNDFIIVRYNTDGTLDTGFGTSGKVVTNFSGSSDDRSTRMFLQGDGKIVLAGGTTQGGIYDLAIARYNSDGSPDVTFNATNTLGGTRSYTENGAAVVLDSDVRIFDADLAAAGSYDGATLTLMRNGGANAEDLLMFDGVTVTTSGANVYVSGTQVGTYTLTGGQLTVTFGTGATQTRVNTLMRNIVYTNASDAPPTSVQINWTFSDGNTGAQGSGGLLTATGSVTVNITAVNDAPVLSNTALTPTVAEDAGAPAGSVGLPVSAFTGGITDADSGAASGIAIVATDETYGTWYYTTDGGTNWNPVGSVSATASLLLADNASTRLYFAPAAHYTGSATSALTLRAWDQTSGTAGTKVSTASTGGTTAFSSATDVIDVTVTTINDAPAGTDRTVTTNEDTDHTLSTADFGFTDPNDAPANALLAVRIATQPGAGALKLSGVAVTAGQSISVADISAGNLKFSPAANANGVAYASFTFQVQDDGGTANGGVDLDTTPNTLTINVTPVNDAPVATAIEGSALAYTENDGPVAITATLTLTDIDDAQLESATVRITGNYVNGEDVLTFTDQNGITGTWNATTGTLTLSGSATVANYQAALRSVAYANSSDNPSTLTRTLSFTVNDGEADSNTVTRNIQITAVNDEQSLAVNGGMSVAENSTGHALSAAVLLTTDVDNSPAQLVYTLTSAPIHGTLRLGGVALTATDTFTQADIDAGLLTYDHDGSETSADSVDFSVDDGAGAPSTGTFNITVTPVNDNAPVITSNGGGATATLSITENTAAVTTVTASDADLPPQTLTYSIVGGTDSALFSIDPSTGALSFAVARDRETATDANGDHVYEVVVQVSDGTLTDTQAISVTITDVDEFDVGAVTDANGAANTVAEDAAIGTAVGITASASDADATNNAITYSLDDDAGGRFAIDATTGVVTVASALDYESATSHAITVRATSADGSFSTQSFTIHVTDVNEAGVGAIADTDGAADFVLENTSVGTVVGVTAFASDPDGTDSVAYSLDDDAGGLFTIDATTGVVTVAGAIDREAAGTYAVTVRATSTDGSFATRIFTLALGDENDNPPLIIGGQRFTILEHSPLGSSLGTVSTLDVDLVGALQQWQIVGGTGLGVFTIDASTGELRVANPAALDYESTSAFTLDLIVSDGVNTSAVVSVTIDVTPVNEAPVLVNNTGAQVEEGGVRIIDATHLRVSDVDTDATQLVYVLTAAPTEGLLWRGSDPLDVGGTFTQADIDAGRLRYVHYGAEPRADSFRFTVSDGSIHLSEGRFEITVTPVNDAPTASDGTVSLDEDSVYAFRTSDFGYHDSDGDALAAVRIESLPTAGELRLHGALVSAGTVVSVADIDAGALTFRGTRDAYGDGYAGFAFTVFDGSVFSSATATLTLNVRPVDDLPTLSVPEFRPKGLPGQEVQFAETFRGLIGVGDVDGEQDQQQLILTVDKGRLWVPTVEGVTWELGSDGTRLVMSGSAAALNAALEGLKLTPPANHVGPLSLRIEARSLLQPEAGPAAVAELAIDLEWPSVPTPGDATTDRSQQPNSTTDSITIVETSTATDNAQRHDRAGLHPIAFQLDKEPSSDDGYGGPTDPGLWLEVTRTAEKPGAATPTERQLVAPLLSAHGKLLFHADVLKLNMELLNTPFEVHPVEVPLRAGTLILPVAQDTGAITQSDARRQILVQSVEYGATGVTIGTVLWLLRSGSLLSSLLLSYPAWRNLDPLPILGASGTGAEDAVRDRARERVRMVNSGTARKEGRAHADNPEQESLDRITS